nr:rod shape-determining protein MreC [uncultured Peptostreptococcus sp.]
MKLEKDNRKRLSIKTILATIVLVLILAITANSLMNGGRLGPVESRGFLSPFYGVGKHLNNVVVGIGDFLGDLVSFRSNSNKIRVLKLENEKLKQKIIDMESDVDKLDSLERLKRSLNYVSNNQRNSLVSASIIGKNNGDWYKSFIIDAGAGSGVKTDSIVINGQGVVGIVYSVSNNYSKAISLIDSRASVSFKLASNNDYKGVITTSSLVGSSDFTDTDKLLQGYLFDSKSNIKKGDLLVTSGLGLYPENIPIGTITSVTYDKNKSMKTIKIKPSVDFKNIDNVSIIPPRKVQ